MHDSYEQTNGVQLDFFTQALCWEYNKPKVQSPKWNTKHVNIKWDSQTIEELVLAKKNVILERSLVCNLKFWNSC